MAAGRQASKQAIETAALVSASLECFISLALIFPHHKDLIHHQTSVVNHIYRQCLLDNRTVGAREGKKDCSIKKKY